MKVGHQTDCRFFGGRLYRRPASACLAYVKTSELSDLASLMYEREMVGAQHVSASNMDMIEATRSVRSAMLAPTLGRAQPPPERYAAAPGPLQSAAAGRQSGLLLLRPHGKAVLADTTQALEAYEVIAKEMASQTGQRPFA